MRDNPNREIRTIRLDELEPLAAELAARIAQTGFKPDVVVIIEEAGRVPGLFLARQFGCAVLPLRIQRPTSRWKRLLAPLVHRAPRAVLDWLRRCEAAATFSRRSERELVQEGAEIRLTGKRVLVFDDAADSGSTLLKAREWALARGAVEICTAVLGATTPLGREVADHFLWEQMGRFPWSSDSNEQAAHAALRERLAGELQAKLFRSDG